MISTELLTLIIALGSIAAAVTAIWILLERISKKFSVIVDTKIESALEKNSKLQEKHLQDMFDIAEKLQEHKFQALRDDLNLFKNEQSLFNMGQEVLTKNQSEAILETFKQDIRDIYYSLRNTGLIEDVDKAYIDKIYTYYTLLGGNSDIHAKVKEINEVYAKRTQEAYDNKAAQIQAKRASKNLILEK